MTYGNKPTDGGFLLLSNSEKNDMPVSAEVFFKRIVGAKEFMDGQIRWCLWIEDPDFEYAMSIPEIASRIDSVREMRLASTKIPTQKLAD